MADSNFAADAPPTLDNVNNPADNATPARASIDIPGSITVSTEHSFKPGSLPHHRRGHSRSVSSSSVSASRKSRYAEPGTTDVHAQPPVFSTHSPSLRSLRSPRSHVPAQRTYSGTSDSILSEDLASLGSASGAPSGDVALDDNDTPRLLPAPSDATASTQTTAGQSTQTTWWSALPEPALTAKSSLSDIQSRRLSGNSVYSLASARGVPVPSPSAPAPTSDPVGRTRSASYLMSSGKSLASTPPEAGLSNITVTTSSATGSGQTSQSHALAPRDPHSQPLDLMRRNQRSETTSTTATTATASRTQPDRSRSRVKRRFSGSTANSSHSPGSDRASHQRPEKEEVKPAPWGVIGICALDVKARSKPSRNILNRVIANREFDVVVFGDKVILDEGTLRDPHAPTFWLTRKLTSGQRWRIGRYAIT